MGLTSRAAPLPAPLCARMQAHIHYLHNDTFGNQGQPQIRDMQASLGGRPACGTGNGRRRLLLTSPALRHSDRLPFLFSCLSSPPAPTLQAVTDAFSVSATFKLHNKPVSAMWEWTSVPEVAVSARALLPSTSVISFELGNGLAFTTFVNTVPVSATKTGGLGGRSMLIRLRARLSQLCHSTYCCQLPANLLPAKQPRTDSFILPTCCCPLRLLAVNRFALVRKLSWDKSGVFNADAWDATARK